MISSDLIDDLDDLGSDSEHEEERGDADQQGDNGEAMEMSLTGGVSKLMEIAMNKKKEMGALRGRIAYKEHMATVDASMRKYSGEDVNPFGHGVLEDNPEYKLMLSSNEVLREIYDEIDSNIGKAGEIYVKRFPELESLIPNKLMLIKTIMKLGNEKDISDVNLSEILPNNIRMIISVTGSASTSTLLSEENLNECMKACQEVLDLEADKDNLLSYLESRMIHVAPNLCAMIGASVSSQLIGLAGGLVALSKVPSCNVSSIGHDKRTLMGLSTAATAQAQGGSGVISQCPLIRESHHSVRKKAMRVLTAKVILASRVDSYDHKSDGSQGHAFRQEIESKIQIWLKPDKARTKKALPIPDAGENKSKRGGKRVRKAKERNETTELAAQRNRISFAAEGGNGEYGDSAMGMDQGMIGYKDSGKIRAIQEKKKDIQLSKKQKKALSVSSNQSAGTASSLVFTPVQGMELANPNAAKERVAAANEKWFNSNSGFLSVAPKR